MTEPLPPDLVERYMELAKAKKIQPQAAHTIVERLCEEVFRLYDVRAKNNAVRQWHEHCAKVAEEVLDEHELYHEYEARLDPPSACDGPEDDSTPSADSVARFNRGGEM